MPTNDREMPKHETVARSVLKDCVGLSWDNTTDTITLTPTSFLLCVQAVLSRHCSDLAPAAQGDVAWLKPELPPYPHGTPVHQGELPRYGLKWNGPDQPLAVPMADGYWTPWHIAAAKPHPAPETIETFKLPFEVKIGNNSFGKGVSFKTFLDSANRYYSYAMESTNTAPVAQSQEVGELFDLKKHRFGMAYTLDRYKGAFYIYDLSRSGATGYGVPVNGSIGQCKPVHLIHIEAARRAPQYDLITAATQNQPAGGADLEKVRDIIRPFALAYRASEKVIVEDMPASDRPSHVVRSTTYWLSLKNFKDASNYLNELASILTTGAKK